MRRVRLVCAATCSWQPCPAASAGALHPPPGHVMLSGGEGVPPRDAHAPLPPPCGLPAVARCHLRRCPARCSCCRRWRPCGGWSRCAGPRVFSRCAACQSCLACAATVVGGATLLSPTRVLSAVAAAYPRGAAYNSSFCAVARLSLPVHLTIASPSMPPSSPCSVWRARRCCSRRSRIGERAAHV
jgi:hypothetical protein